MRPDSHAASAPEHRSPQEQATALTAPDLTCPTTLHPHRRTLWSACHSSFRCAVHLCYPRRRAMLPAAGLPLQLSPASIYCYVLLANMGQVGPVHGDSTST
jgi:hypothetical protein